MKFNSCGGNFLPLFGLFVEVLQTVLVGLCQRRQGLHPLAREVRALRLVLGALLQRGDLRLQRWQQRLALGALIARLDGGHSVLQRGDLLLRRVGSTNADQCIACELDGILDAKPRPLDVPQVLQHLRSALLDHVGIGLLGYPSRVDRAALLGQRLDLLVDRAGQEVGALVELQRRGQWVFCERGKGLGRLFGRRPADRLQAQRRSGEPYQVASADIRAAGHLVQDLGCPALRAGAGRLDRCGHVHQLARGDARHLAGEDDGALECLRLVGAHVVRHRQPASGQRRQRERVDEAEHVAAQRTGSAAGTAEHVFQLPTLLQEHGERRLAALQAGEDVGELRRHPTQRSGGLLGADAHLVERAGRRLLCGLGLAQRVQVGLQGVAADTALFGQGLVVTGAATLAGLHGRGGALDAADDRLGGLVDLLG